MKTIIYLSKEKFWVGEKEYLVGEDLEKSIGEAVAGSSLGEVRIVLGDSVSYVVGFKLKSALEKREEILRMAQSLIPINLDTNNFDWKKKKLANGEVWVETIAVDREVLNGLSKAILNNKVDVKMMTPMASLLAKVVETEAVTLVKYEGKESIVGVVVGGVTESVFEVVEMEEAKKYAKSKYGIETDIPEKSVDSSSAFLESLVFAEKTKGEDEEILTIPLLTTIEVLAKLLVPPTVGSIVPSVEQKEVKEINWKLIGMIGVLVASLSILGFVIKGQFKKPEVKKVVETPVVTLTPTASPTAEMIDYGKYKVQVLNGSGVTGLAGKIKETLLADGYKEIETGNAESATLTLIKAKSEVPSVVLEKMAEKLKDYQIGEKVVLTMDSIYDLVIVVGSLKK